MDKRTLFLRDLACWAAAAAALWLTLRYAARWLLPFLIALAVASAAEPAVLWCRRTLRLRRSFTAAVVTLLLAGAALTAATAVARRLWQEAAAALAALPDTLALWPALTDRLFDRLDDFCSACPDGVRQWAERAVQLLAAQLSDRAAALSRQAVQAVASAVAALPQLLLFWGTTALAVFFTVAGYPRITAFLRRQIPPPYHALASGVKESIFTTLGKWLKAQCILLGVTFVQLLAGFLLLRQPYALLLALLIALIDALPVLGTGTVLLPWALLRCAVGSVPSGIALAALYAVTVLVRSILEPRVVAAQAGLPPLAALAAMYVGFCAMGVGGMLLFPIGLLLVQQLRGAGWLRLWK